MRYFDYVKRVVPMHDDLYDFFLQELPGYDMVGYRETNLVNWGSFDDPDYVDYDYRHMTDWGRKRYITPGIAIGGELITTDLVRDQPRRSASCWAARTSTAGRTSPHS